MSDQDYLNKNIKLLDDWLDCDEDMRAEGDFGYHFRHALMNVLNVLNELDALRTEKKRPRTVGEAGVLSALDKVEQLGHTIERKP